MSQSYKCPICGKDGIPNFRKEDVVCPCCGSDLSIYNKIRELTQERDETTKTESLNGRSLKLLIGILFAVILFLSGYIFFVNTYKAETTNESDIVANLTKQVEALQDSINKLNTQVKEASNSSSQENYRIYIVKKGDCIRRISRTELGTEQRFEEIATINSLSKTALIHPGDTLKIPEQ